jgi:hypothetical protein
MDLNIGIEAPIYVWSTCAHLIKSRTNATLHRTSDSSRPGAGLHQPMRNRSRGFRTQQAGDAPTLTLPAARGRQAHHRPRPASSADSRIRLGEIEPSAERALALERGRRCGPVYAETVASGRIAAAAEHRAGRWGAGHLRRQARIGCRRRVGTWRRPHPATITDRAAPAPRRASADLQALENRPPRPRVQLPEGSHDDPGRRSRPAGVPGRLPREGDVRVRPQAPLRSACNTARQIPQAYQPRRVAAAVECDTRRHESSRSAPGSAPGAALWPQLPGLRVDSAA